MTEAQRTPDQVTLDDLRRAIQRVSEYRALPLTLKLEYAHGGALEERDAWRTAFEWQSGITAELVSEMESGVPTSAIRNLLSELDEGTRLIREKLQS